MLAWCVEMCVGEMCVCVEMLVCVGGDGVWGDVGVWRC